jgi:REP element-mobilizing transposase RayT
MQTVGIHVIWTTYMTWPPGDPRGHWSALMDVYGHIIREGGRLNKPDPITLEHANEVAEGPAVILNDVEQRAVADRIGKMLIDDSVIAGSRAFAAAIEQTHVHLLFSSLRYNVNDVVGRIKSQTSSILLESRGQPEVRRIWTNGFWKVFLFDAEGVAAVQNYVEEHNERRGMARSPYVWLRPYPVPPRLKKRFDRPT